MPKFGELDWSDLKKSEEEEYDHTPTALWAADMYGGGKVGVDPLRDNAEPLVKKGEVPKPQSNEEIAEFILRDAPRQPTDEEMFGQFVVTEEMAKKAQEDWDNQLNNMYKSMQAPIIPEQEQDTEWGSGKSFNDTLSEEERLKRNMYKGE